MDKEINKKIQDMIKNKSHKADIFQYVKSQCQIYQLTPQTLGMLFELYADVRYDNKDPLACFSKEIKVDELKNIHPGFRSTNGCQWARSDNSCMENTLPFLCILFTLYFLPK